MIITATATGIFYALEAANIKLPKASMDAMEIIKLAGSICGGVLLKDYALYKKMDQRVIQQQTFMALLGSIKFTQRHYISLFSIVKIPLGSVTFRRAVASSGLNT